MPRRQGNDPKRRIADEDEIAAGVLDRLTNEVRYVGSPHHKRRPADYGFHPPVSPRGNKSVCDGSRSVKRDEAKALFREGVRRGMVSRCRDDALPKYVWAVDEEGRAYEALSGRGGEYHGYELGDGEEAMRRWVIEQWNARCPQD